MPRRRGYETERAHKMYEETLLPFSVRKGHPIHAVKLISTIMLSDISLIVLGPSNTKEMPLRKSLNTIHSVEGLEAQKRGLFNVYSTLSTEFTLITISAPT